MIYEILIAILFIIIAYLFMNKFNTVLLPPSKQQMSNVYYQPDTNLNI